ncbi:transcription factor E2F3-like [Xyrauchen texanus]|uniref:transcription factor E2F3-like n=1 Tax=Xyrauchen texanus TaxID=154827 RepID=UPI0022428517|nr:transcription factor E2F3-like [Xyrauchen texanus]
MVPFLRSHPEMTLQHDNATSHIAHSVISCKTGICPDLKPIEHVWDLLNLTFYFKPGECTWLNLSFIFLLSLTGCSLSEVGGVLSERQTLSSELTQLVQEEHRLDELIQSCTQEVKRMTESSHNQKFAYVTYQDLRQDRGLRDQTVIVVKAPSETKLEVPDPQESLQVHLTSTKGPIDVFLCPDESTTDSPVKNSSFGVKESSSPFMKVLNDASSSLSGPAVTVTSLSPITSPFTSLLQQTEDQIPCSEGPFINLLCN